MNRTPKVLVIGDVFGDYTRLTKATRLCPEAPVPVLVQTKEYTTAGGAGLVEDQLVEFLGRENVIFIPMSFSCKERIFADDRLMCRIDDEETVLPTPAERLTLTGILREIVPQVDAVVVSDYGKGGLDKQVREMLAYGRGLSAPLFVDAKNNFPDYKGFSAIVFPNERESIGHDEDYELVVRKLSSRGCRVGTVDVSKIGVNQVVDVTGAGDIFMAAFVAKYLTFVDDGDGWSQRNIQSAKFANMVAGQSVEWVGTHIVKGIDISKKV